MMAVKSRFAVAVFTGLLLSLASCASSPKAVAPAPAVAIVSGKAMRGVITATRPVTDPAAIQTGVNGVLTALHASASQPGAVSATEYVVRRSDDTSVVIVASTGSFSLGQRVEIIDGTPPELLHAN